MFPRRIDDIVRHVSLIMWFSSEDRRSGEERRKNIDRRSEPRYGESPERRINSERRQAFGLAV